MRLHMAVYHCYVHTCYLLVHIIHLKKCVLRFYGRPDRSRISSKTVHIAVVVCYVVCVYTQQGKFVIFYTF